MSKLLVVAIGLGFGVAGALVVRARQRLDADPGNRRDASDS